MCSLPRAFLIALVASTIPRLACSPVSAQDCNANGVPDAVDVTAVYAPELSRRQELEDRFSAQWSRDLDGDGDLDLLTLWSDRFAAVLLNDGRGEFVRAGPFEFPFPEMGVALGDLDGDGDVDVAMASRQAFDPPPIGMVLLYRNDGAGTFVQSSVLARIRSPRGLQAIDVDEDGDLDLAVATEDDAIEFLRNDGNGEFSAAGAVFSDADGSRRVDIADLDGDGTSELVLTRRVPSRSLYRVQRAGDGTFDDDSVEEVVPGVTGDSWQLVDLDGDDMSDLIVVESDNAVQIYRNTGGEFEPTYSHAFGRRGTSIFVRDLDSDGLDDLAAVHGSPGAVSILLASSPFTFHPAGTYYLAPVSASDPDIADFDGDGLVDILSRPLKGNSIQLTRSLGAGVVGAPRLLPRDLSDPPNAMVAVDLDGDGTSELVVSTLVSKSRNGLIAYRALDGGPLSRFTEVLVDGLPDELVTFDIDLDGDGDIVASNRLPPYSLYVFENFRDGSLRAPRVLPTQDRVETLHVGDFNGDGLGDLALTVDYPAGVPILLNDGPGSFVEASTISWEQRLASPPVDIVLGDFDGDGLDDVLVGPSTGYPTRFYRSRGDGTFVHAANLSDVEFFRVATAADADGDSNLDLIAVNGADSLIQVYWNDGAGLFSPTWSIETEDQVRALRALDIDRSGTMDLLVTGNDGAQGNASECRLLLYLGAGEGTFDQALQVFAGTRSSSSLLLADLDGDRVQDLVTANWDQDQSEHTQLTLSPGLFRPQTSADRNRDGSPDECDLQPFHRGDANADGALDISDGQCLLEFLFMGSAAPPCLESADANNDGRIDCSDPLYSLEYLFRGKAPPPSPGPGEPCGPDTDPVDSVRFLGCASYAPCDGQLEAESS